MRLTRKPAAGTVARMPTDDFANVPPHEVGRVRVLVVDAHPIVRRGLADALHEEPGFVMCGEAGSASEALMAAGTLRPDVIVVDLSLGDDSGLDLVVALGIALPAARMLILSARDERLYVHRALKAGALGYVHKSRPTSELLDAIRKVAAGQMVVSEETATRILSPMDARHPRGDGVDSPLARLSNRERHVLTLVARGYGTREIAEHLQVSIKTIESHYAHMKDKLSLRSVRELTRLAISWNEQGDL